MAASYPPLVESDPNKMEKTGLPSRLRSESFAVAVVGGGMAGICAAVAAARHGAKTVLIQDRPVLGGNASSEIRVCVCGAESAGQRETGIIEEILLENRFLNPQDSYTVWDHLLYDFATREKNLSLMLNTQAVDAVVKDSAIVAAVCRQLSTESEVEIKADVFIDCSGDGLLAAAAGAPYRTGREASSEFDESYAPAKADGWQMGASLLLSTRDMGRPMPYAPPSFAIKLSPDFLRKRHIDQIAEGFWWIELGSDGDIVAAQESNRHQLMGYLHGVWDFIKNSGKFPQSANLVLDWVGSVPGKRESRRFMGDYVLSQKDLTESRRFDDAVAFGGWPIDEHCPGGILSPDLPPTNFHCHFKEPYQIPFRSLYSRTVSNLLFAGRNVSQTHIALASTRVMATGALMGQATGTAAALCVKYGVSPRELGRSRMHELQETLTLDDAYLPGLPASGEGDLARIAKITASSTSSGAPGLLADGVSRDETAAAHHWESDGLGAELRLDWESPVELSQIVLKLDSDLKKRLWKVMKQKSPGSQAIDPVPAKLAKRLDIDLFVDGEWRRVAAFDNIRKRLLKAEFPSVKAKSARIAVHETYGHPNASLFEIRCYGKAPFA